MARPAASYSSRRKRGASNVTVDVSGADGVRVAHLIPRAIFGESAESREARRDTAPLPAVPGTDAAGADGSEIVVVRNPRRRKPNSGGGRGRSKHPANANASDSESSAGWWRTLDGIDPISLEPLRQLPVPPFTLRSAMAGDTSHSHFFDAEVLANYFTRTADFSNPITREALTNADCVRLDKHLARFDLNEVGVADAFLLAQHIMAQQVAPGAPRASAAPTAASIAAAARAPRSTAAPPRPHAAARDATVVMHSMFSFSSQSAGGRDAGRGAAESRGAGARGGAQRTAGGQPRPRPTSAPSAVIDARYRRHRRVVHAAHGSQIIDDDDWVSEEEVEDLDAGGSSSGAPSVPWSEASRRQQRDAGAPALNPTARVFRPTKTGFAALLRPDSSAARSGGGSGTSTAAAAAAIAAAAAVPTSWSKAKRACAPRRIVAGGGSSWRDRTGNSASDAPRRPRLALKKRSAPSAERGASSESEASSIFGGGRSRHDVLASNGIDSTAHDLAVERSIAGSGVAAGAQTRLCPFVPSLLAVALTKRAWVARLEEQLACVVQGSTSSVAGVSAALDPMRREQRRFVHALCECYGLVAKAQDDEPNRFIVVTRGPHPVVPALRLASAAARFAPAFAGAALDAAARAPGDVVAAIDADAGESTASSSKLQRALAALIAHEERERRRAAYHLHLWSVRGSSATASSAELTRELRGAFEGLTRRSEFDVTLVGDAALGHVVVEFASRSTARRILHRLCGDGAAGTGRGDAAETVHLGSASFKCEWWSGGVAWLRRQLALLVGAESDTGSAAAAEHEAARLKRQQKRAERAAAEIAAKRDAKLTWHQSDAIAPSAFGALASESSDDSGGESAAPRDDAPRVGGVAAARQMLADAVEAPSPPWDEDVAKLCEMGFGVEAAHAELARCDGDVGAAIDALASSDAAAWQTAEVL